MALGFRRDEELGGIEEFERLAREFAVRRDLDNLVRIILQLTKILFLIKSKLDKIDSEFLDLRGEYETLTNKIVDIDKKIDNINIRLSHVELSVGGLVEAYAVRIFLEHLDALGYIVKESARNYRIDNEDIDLLVIAEKDGVEKHFIVEVKVRPKHSDVGALIAKAELYMARARVEGAVPVLAGVYIGREVENYAKSRGVLVFRV